MGIGLATEINVNRDVAGCGCNHPPRLVCVCVCVIPRVLGTCVILLHDVARPRKEGLTEQMSVVI